MGWIVSRVEYWLRKLRDGNPGEEGEGAEGQDVDEVVERDDEVGKRDDEVGERDDEKEEEEEEVKNTVQAEGNEATTLLRKTLLNMQKWKRGFTNLPPLPSQTIPISN